MEIGYPDSYKMVLKFFEFNGVGINDVHGCLVNRRAGDTDIVYTPKNGRWKAVFGKHGDELTCAIYAAGRKWPSTVYTAVDKCPEFETAFKISKESGAYHMPASRKRQKRGKKKPQQLRLVFDRWDKENG